MNPLASAKCARRVLMALAAVSALLFAVACGSSNNKITTNNQGFSNTSLNGTYVFSSTGADTTNGVLLAFAGEFTANGSANSPSIAAGGMIDINSFAYGQLSTAITGGSYSVNNDGTGQVTLNFSGGSITLAFVLIAQAAGPTGAPSAHGLISEFDGNGTGSGTLDLQTAGSLTGSYTFGLSGESLVGNNVFPLAMIGTFAYNSATGGITGLSDINNNGGVPGGTTGLTFSNSSITSGSPGNAIFSSYNSSNSLVATYNFHVYMVDPTHLKFIETDAAPILAGDAFTQQTSTLNGVYAYTMASEDSGGFPLAMGGFVTAGSGNQLTSGLEDYNDSGLTPPVNQLTNLSGNFTTPSGGRSLVTIAGFYNGTAGSGITLAAYPSASGVELLEVDGLGITGGMAIAQGSVSSSTVGGSAYAFNLSGFNLTNAWEVDDIAEFASVSSSYTGAEYVNSGGTSGGSTSFDPTFTADTSITGHGTATLPSSSNPSAFYYYLADSGSTALVLETDTNQVGLGGFELQTSTAVDATSAMVSAQHRVMIPRGAAAKRKK